MFQKLLIANRGAIACRILRTVKAMGIRSVAIYSEADANAPHVRDADEAYCVGQSPAAESYLRHERILEIARECGAAAIHPGYGFLSENAGFAAACEAAGIAFIGPTPAQMRQFGLKHTARELAQQAGLPLLPGTDLLPDLPAALAAADRIGYPVMLKSTAGGGGIGMRRCNDARDLEESFAAVQRLAEGNFRNAGVFLEKFLARARHIEVQIFGDGAGQVIALGERDCSVQRRNQKVIEESPAPGLADAARRELHESAARLGRAVGYRSAGTVEFVYDADAARFYFLEVNTRLQVEHPVTERVTGVDLVHAQIAIARGEALPFDQHALAQRGHAIEARIYAEDPSRDDLPQAGPLLLYREPSMPGVRIDSGVTEGGEVSVHYDPLVAKLIADGPTREIARRRAVEALRNYPILGIRTNVAFLIALLEHPRFVAGDIDTRFLDAEGESLRSSGAVPDEAMAVAASLGAPAASGGIDPWDALRGFHG
jgi:urea carboxylase